MLEQIITLVKSKVPEKQQDLIAIFSQEFFSDIVWSEIGDRKIEDLAGAVLSHWRLFYQRKKGSVKVSVFNPQEKREHWSCPNTVIQVVHDDMPFLVDSLQMELTRLKLPIFLVIHLGGIKLERDPGGHLVALQSIKSPTKLKEIEAPIYIEIEQQNDPKVLENICFNLERVLADVRATYYDWGKMRQEVENAIATLEQDKNVVSEKTIQEAGDFLRWMLEGNFIFLGVCHYQAVQVEGREGWKLVSGSNLGILAKENESEKYYFYDQVPKKTLARIFSNEPLFFSETKAISTVHRAAYTNSVLVKFFDQKGKVKSLLRIIGLYTSNVNFSSITKIPVQREKFEKIMQAFAYPREGHAAKTLAFILETLPRTNFFFQADQEELFTIAQNIYQLHERRIVKVFLHQDVYHRFMSCLVYLPRDNFNTEVRRKIQEKLIQTLGGITASFDVSFSDSVLARIYFVIRLDSQKQLVFDEKKLEEEVVLLGSSWEDILREELFGSFEKRRAREWLEKYARAMPVTYREVFKPEEAILDFAKIEKLSKENLLEMRFYQDYDNSQIVHLKLFSLGQEILLSESLPIFENMGFVVHSEQSYRINLLQMGFVWISDFTISCHRDIVHCPLDVKDVFEEAFKEVWYGRMENDGFNQLINAGLSVREIVLLRAYAKYLKQIHFPFTSQYIVEALSNNDKITRILVALFKLRFDPSKQDDANRENTFQESKSLDFQFERELDAVLSLDQDRILRQIKNLIDHTLRTNYFLNKEIFSFKFDAEKISEMPLPKPWREIFVYSPNFEGVHLRMGSISRGGIRWSDRREDFRSEILGLMKAQQVKNAIIVPYGAKGGFVLKNSLAKREELQKASVVAYQAFIASLLALTDNVVKNQVLHPESVVCYDDFDPYLVVAADKGTAGFSNLANKISEQNQFWLGDAFASGGETGYDHKKLGITAKGAWESVKSHFAKLSINPDRDSFTVIGIGDMSGDVFGNGMLLSENIKLIAAFNHRTIFVDPNPDSLKSFTERKRLFSLPQSDWQDYDQTILSPGGGIYQRSAKFINLSKEAQNALGIERETLTPNELIRAILSAPVDLFWNGGIGTYVKASEETDFQVRDLSNDALRINASQLRCRVIAEGGNLGLTQLARIEYALRGGIINTDFIDNSGGVDCSDHEVNLKIMLDLLVKKEKISGRQRNLFLSRATSEVEAMVLADNYQQTRAIDILVKDSVARFDAYVSYLNHQEEQQNINRALEFLPSNKNLSERKVLNEGLTRPEMSILLAYAKLVLKKEILKSELICDSYFNKYFSRMMPKFVAEKFVEYFSKHKLYREIISTRLANDFITDLGVTFVFDTKKVITAEIEEIIFAYVIVDEIFKLSNLSNLSTLLLENNDSLPGEVQNQLQLQKKDFFWRAVHFALRSKLGLGKKISELTSSFSEKLSLLNKQLSHILPESIAIRLASCTAEIKSAGVAEDLAMKLSHLSIQYLLVRAILEAACNKCDLLLFTKIFFLIVEKLQICDLLHGIDALEEEGQDQITKIGLKDKVERNILRLSLIITKKKDGNKDFDLSEKVKQWFLGCEGFDERWGKVINQVKTKDLLNFALIHGANEELEKIAGI
jgi:glutamate dehydrogenase